METQTQERPTVERQMFTARLTKSILLSPQTKHLELTVEGMDEFRFTPGQFVSIKQPEAGRQGTHARVFHRVAAASECHLRSVPEPRGPRLSVELAV